MATHDPAPVRRALIRNLNWFLNSGVMHPSDGSWGVAERIVVTPDNAALEKIYASFPAWTPGDGYSVIEQRRADCCFQTALLFLLASRVLDQPAHRAVAQGLLDFLYHRSGLLHRSADVGFLGAWTWSHIQRVPALWFDDNGWVAAIQFMIADLDPTLDQRYGMKTWALRLTENLLEVFMRSFGHAAPGTDEWSDPDKVWQGDLRLPHWGAPVCLALARAARAHPNPRFADAVRRYHAYLAGPDLALNTSETAYALIGAEACAATWPEALYRDVSDTMARRLLARMTDAGDHLPAEHFEAPAGTNLVDFIYTFNWALLGMQMKAASDDAHPGVFADAYRRLRALALRVQDAGPAPAFAGCWRGMYDLAADRWGGGDRFEGGAGSIYSGWTNAPMAWTLALELGGQTLNSL